MYNTSEQLCNENNSVSYQPRAANKIQKFSAGDNRSFCNPLNTALAITDLVGHPPMLDK